MKKFFTCKICGIEIDNSINWRRDLQDHFNRNHKKDRKRISAAAIKQKHFELKKKG